MAMTILEVSDFLLTSSLNSLQYVIQIFTEAQPFNDIQNDRLVVPSVVFHRKRPLLPPCLSKNAVVKDLINKCWVQDPKSRPSAVDILGIIKGVRSSIP